MIRKEKLRIVFMVMYFIMVMSVSWTVMNSPFMAGIYIESIAWISGLMLITLYYMMDWKYLKVKIKKIWFDANVRAMQRKEAAAIIKKRYDTYRKA